MAGESASSDCRFSGVLARGRRRDRDGGKRVQRREDLRRPSLVALAQSAIIVLGQMPGLVIEVELLERPIHGRLVLLQLEPIVREDPGRGGSAATSPPHQW